MPRTLALLLLSLLFWSAQALAGVNVNAASQKELESLPGIGPSKAQAILEYRRDNGPFASLSDLDRVPGIGPATLDNLRPIVEFGEAGATPAASSRRSEEEPAADAVNINTAGAKELESLPGIGPSKAAAIVGDREANGPFASCDSLTRVTGIGRATVSALAGHCRTK